jgi:hypothetical protein
MANAVEGDGGEHVLETGGKNSGSWWQGGWEKAQSGFSGAMEHGDCGRLGRGDDDGGTDGELAIVDIGKKRMDWCSKWGKLLHPRYVHFAQSCIGN